MEAGTRVCLPVQHFEPDVAFVGHVAVQPRGDIGDVLSLSGNVPGGSDKQGDDPNHRSSEYCIAGIFGRSGDADRVASAV
jgi:hypothetical protein